jgi:hypothetical protein
MAEPVHGSRAHGFGVGLLAGLARVRPKQAELRKFGNTLSSIICDGLRQPRINQAF